MKAYDILIAAGLILTPILVIIGFFTETRQEKVIREKRIECTEEIEEFLGKMHSDEKK